MNFLDAVVQGLMLGGLYAIFAAGLSLIFGVMKIVSLSYGAFAVMAAYLALHFTEVTGWSPLLSLLLVVPLMAAFGWVLQRYVLQRTLGNSALPSILVTFGLAVIIENVLLLTESADQKRMTLGAIDTAAFEIGFIRVGVYPFGLFIASIVLLGILSLVMAKTQFGRAVRAISEDASTVELMGIRPKSIYAWSAAIALALAAIAGVASGIQTSFSPLSGGMLLIFAFEAVIIGGIGSLWGTFVGALVLGLAQTIGASFFPSQGILIGNIVFLIFLAFLPQGISGKVKR
ncbi:branched-chain amino acid transport system permease protein [Aurantimicrobium minutum]|uniref:branched-chain amino acid ABC transporter permease n=1 Tax=Aurantimicrobium minutum TaxID=708131 RepID=UPI0024758A71|nr:branched-chain amino acid ABC transporter permease [Aurantimicrobium minutum]MDH6532580.1 branched-chain amino acid transport system permease protein [Aurantimicrobium minutum]